jgi:hypothetical protein
VKRRLVSAATVMLLLAMSLSITACPAHKGPAQRTGEKLDKALGTDK